MPVRKFRSVEETNQLPWRQPGDPMLYQAIAGVWQMARRTNARRFPPGVWKYRSVEEMSRAREQSIDEHVKALAKQRHGR
jgi:hypothetical protein